MLFFYHGFLLQPYPLCIVFTLAIRGYAADYHLLKTYSVLGPYHKCVKEEVENIKIKHFFYSRFLPQVCATIQPFLPPLSVIVTALCVGSPLAINVESIVSPFGLIVLSIIIIFHASAFVAGYFLPRIVFDKTPDLKALQRTISFETGPFT